MLTFAEFLLIIIVWFEVARFLLQVYPKLSKIKNPKGLKQGNKDEFYHTYFKKKEGSSDGQQAVDTD
jgi:hypothetical protein